MDDVVSFLDSSRHIIVLCRGSFYKIPVLGADGRIIASRALLAKRMEEVIAHASSLQDPSASAVGALTTGPRHVWEAARRRLEESSVVNRATLSAIDEAIVIVALDDQVHGRGRPLPSASLCCMLHPPSPTEETCQLDNEMEWGERQFGGTGSKDRGTC